jgi:putative tricarboxylic transport membrane protein
MATAAVSRMRKTANNAQLRPQRAQVFPPARASVTVAATNGWRRETVARLGVALAVVCACVVAGCGRTAGGGGGGGGDSASYPSSRVEIMAPADPGGGWDETARALQQSIRDSKLSGKGVEVYNVPGAGGTLGLSQLASKDKGDPHQLMVMGLVMLGAIETNKSSVHIDQTTPIATLTEEAEAIVVPAKSKFKTLADLMAALKADPGSVRWAGGSAGGTDQLLVGLLAKAAGADASKTKYVAYSGGGEAKTAILSGSVDAGVSGVSEFADQVEAGKMRALAVSGADALPVGGEQTQSIKAQGFDVELTNWRGIVAPPGISDSERDAVVKWVEKVRSSPAWQANLKRFAWTDMHKSGPEFQTFLTSEQQRVQQLVGDLGLAGG